MKVLDVGEVTFDLQNDSALSDNVYIRGSAIVLLRRVIGRLDSKCIARTVASRCIPLSPVIFNY